jgi:hypothetical protein
MRISCSDGVVTSNVSLFAALLTTMIPLLLRLHLLEVRVQTIESSFPDLPVALGPLGDLFERPRFDAAWPPLGLASARNKTRPLEQAEML